MMTMYTKKNTNTRHAIWIECYLVCDFKYDYAKLMSNSIESIIVKITFFQ